MIYRFFLSLTLLLSLTTHAKHIELTQKIFYLPKSVSYSHAMLDTADLIPLNDKYKGFTQKGIYVISSEFNSNQIDLQNSPSLFLSPCSYSVIITLNDLEIYRWGEFNNLVSMTNFGASTIVLPNIKNGENKLKLYFYNDDRDLPLPTFHIDNYHKAAFKASLQTLFNLYFIQGIAIIALFSSILFFAYSAASKFKEYDILYFAIFAFSIFMGYTPFIMNSPVSNDLFWLKISRIGYIIASLLLFLFSCEYTGYKPNKLIKRILIILNLFIIFIYSTSISQSILNHRFSLFSITYILPLLFWSYGLLIRSLILKKSLSTKFIILGYTLFLCSTTHDIISVLIAKDPYFWITPYGYFFLITSIILAVVLRYYHGIEEKNIAQQQLKESEEKYRQVYNAPNDGIFIQDPDTLKIIDSNKIAQQMFGYSDQEIKSLTIADLSSNKPPYTMKEARQLVDNLISNGSVQSFEWHAKRKDGHLFWVEVHIKKTTIANNNRVLIFFRDISLRNKLEENLRQSQKMEAIGTLAGGVAHDFNNILSGIIGYAELILMDTKKDKSIQININEIIKGSERARELVQQILTFSRKKSPIKKSVSLKNLIEESSNLLRSSIPTNIKFNFNLESKSLIEANATQIHQLILNLCTNSYHAMEDKGGTLSIRLSDEFIDKENTIPGTKLNPGNYIKLVISDTGTGIPKDKIKRIFDPYYTTKKEGHGTGLGLSVVHGIIKDHKGEISVYSEENRGTTFNIYLPISNNSELPIDNINFDNINLTGTEHILFADDEKTISTLASKVFPKHGYKITTCTSGDEAWEKYKNSPDTYDLLITDMTMPGMSGLELSRKVLSVNSKMPIIISSGYSNFIDEEIAKNEKISVFLRKPINLRELLKSVRYAIETK